MALKVMIATRKGNNSFKVERDVLNKFKQASNKSEGISMNFATFVHGQTLNIISTWADTDLFNFLRGKYSGFYERARRLTPRHLFEQTRCLANALHFLHDELDIGGPVSCAHLDLKLENILVEFQPADTSGGGTKRDDEVPAGLWKINDFGISVLRDKDEHTRHQAAALLTPGDVNAMYRESSSVPSPRGDAAFMPPESNVSTKSDMWSLGCIISMVLAFVLGGPEMTGELHGCRKSGYKNDCFYVRSEDEQESPYIKPEVSDWFAQQTESPDFVKLRPCISHTADLVFRLLDIEKSKRPKATEAVTDLKTIRNLSENLPLPWSPKPDNSYDNLEDDQYPKRHPPPRDSSPVAAPHEPLGDTQTRPPPFNPLTDPAATTDRLRITRTSSKIPHNAVLQLETPPNVLQATLSASGDRVGFVSRSTAWIYDLSSLGNLNQSWKPETDNADRIYQQSMLSSRQTFPCPDGRKWTSGHIAGSFIALLSETTNNQASQVRGHH